MTVWLGPWKGPYRLAWFAVLALALVNVWFGPLNQDEGWYLLAAQNVSRGMTPYRDFLYTQGPVLPYAYGWIAGAWSDVGVLGGRLVTAVFGFLATVFFSLVAGELARRRNPDAFGPAFLLAFVLLGLSPDWAYFTAIPKTYALGSFLLALGFALSLGAPGVPNRRGSAIAGACFALAAATRATLCLAAVPVYYSGPIDRLFGYRYGELPWRSLAFERETLDIADFQGTSVVNYTEAEVPYTRIHEFKHYHPEDKAAMARAKTVIMREYPRAWRSGDEPYYPVNNPESQALLEKYRTEAAQIEGLTIGGRLGEYRYYDMDQSVGKALELMEGVR